MSKREEFLTKRLAERGEELERIKNEAAADIALIADDAERCGLDAADDGDKANSRAYLSIAARIRHALKLMALD